jgi:hypothetical protein
MVAAVSVRIISWRQWYASLPAPMINTRMVKAARKAFISGPKTVKIA